MPMWPGPAAFVSVGDVVSVGALVLGGAAALFLVARRRGLRLLREAVEELRFRSIHDPLTGLANRTLIVDRIEQLLARTRRNQTPGAVLVVNLDGFKNVNGVLGYAAGDRLLQAVAERLTKQLREVDGIGRIGGDEFVVVVDGSTYQLAPELVAERILDLVRQPFTLGDRRAPATITASVGVAFTDGHGAGALLRDADVALAEAKAAGKNCFVCYGPNAGVDVHRRYELEFDVRGALDRDEFHLEYQPIYRLDDLTPTGVEALLRWDHPTRGQVRPDEFIPLLESSDEIVRVGRWVLHHASRQVAAWRALGLNLEVAVNVSARQLDRDIIVRDILDALAASGLPPAALTLEVTETAVMRNLKSAIRNLTDAKALGVRVAIDDFGTGYSSLAYLQRLPIDCLKIDRSFVDAMGRSDAADALVHAVVQLGRDLRLQTLAEGVETAAQIDRLRGEHVDSAQGFLLARPLDAATLERQVLRPAAGLDDDAPTTRR